LRLSVAASLHRQHLVAQYKREVVSASIGHPASPSQLDPAIPVTSPDPPDRAEAEGAIAIKRQEMDS
jgi:hypothetical protein